MRIERTGLVEKLTPRVTQFLVEALGGVSLDDIQSAERRRIDYACLRGLVAVEVKTLEGNPAERTNNFVDSLRDRPDFPIFFGSVPMEAAFENMEDPDALRRTAVDRLGRTIVTHLKKANDQLNRHALDFPRPNRASIVVLINEDHPEYDPQTVGWLVQREFAREDDRGARYPSIDAVLYFTERHGQVRDGLIAFPTAAIHGPNIDFDNWKAGLLDHVVHRWAAWNGRPLKAIDDDEAAAFEAFDHVPEAAPRHERWRLDYRRKPYLRPFTDDALRDRFDEVMLVTTLWGTKGSPIKLDMAAAMVAMEQFTHIQVEMHDRALPMTAFAHKIERQLAAAVRLNLPQAAIDWLQELDKDVQDRAAACSG